MRGSSRRAEGSEQQAAQAVAARARAEAAAEAAQAEAAEAAGALREAEAVAARAERRAAEVEAAVASEAAAARGLPFQVTESDFSVRKQVQKTCQFWLLTFGC